MKEIRPDPRALFISMVFDFFLRPVIIMAAWVAFLHMSELNLPHFGYWEVFMLNIVCIIFASSPITRWTIKDKKTED